MFLRGESQVRAKLCIIIICLNTLFLTGCQSSRKIETASIVENVSISEENGSVCYTFYVLGSGDKPKGYIITADSFEKARELAENEYIPNMSLSKLELLMIEDSLIDRVLRTDIEYISTQPSFSPTAFVTLCDRKTLEKFAEKTDEQDLIEEQLILLKKNNPEISINYLSVFNRFESGKIKEFTVGYVTSENELKISGKKLKNIAK